ncbi:MAG: hypothetical protein QW322_07230, partial [Saccharolobus sp.]|uniref:hypothetical protein n=1 Tax=Saccharolobus sp. TaxID=2100761 RepID=UPI00317A836C
KALDSIMAERILEKLTVPHWIMLAFGSSLGCLSLEELERKTRVDRKTLTVYLSRMTKEGIIYRKWRKIAGKKFREYCLKYREELTR